MNPGKFTLPGKPRTTAPPPVSLMKTGAPVLREGWPDLSDTPLARRRSTDAGPWRHGVADLWRRDNPEPSEWNEGENVPGSPRTFRVD